MKNQIIKQESKEPTDASISTSKKTNTGISNSFLQQIISLLKKEELI